MKFFIISNRLLILLKKYRITIKTSLDSITDVITNYHYCHSESCAELDSVLFRNLYQFHDNPACPDNSGNLFQGQK